MKVAIYFDGFVPFHQFKDPGLICLGLKEGGVDVSLITLEKRELQNIQLPFNVIQITNPFKEGILKDFDVFIVYSWISAQNTKLIKYLKSLGKCVIIKSDSDGRVGLISNPKPRFQNFYKRPILKNLPIFLLKKFFYIGRTIEKSKLKQIDVADYIVLESPEAVQNLVSFLSNYNRQDLIGKIRMIADPVADDIFDLIDHKAKKNIIVAIGRWDDFFQKNTEALAETLGIVLSSRDGWMAIVLGSGENCVRKYLSKLPTKISERILIMGPIPHGNIKNILLKSKIFFMPSRYESFGIGAAEALCCGCSVVGTPIEPLKFLTMQGFSGVTASSFDPKSLAGSLIFEIEKYERGEVNGLAVADFWKKRLNKLEIAEEFKKLFYAEHD